MNAAETYSAMIDAVNDQRARIHGKQSIGERWDDTTAARFRVDPHRQLNPNLETLASFINPEDVLLDVGGGAGRMCLPLALRCREVINADPSAAMLRQFTECAAEAGINNVRQVQGDWLEVDGVSADVVLSCHVVYFVREVRSFIEKLHAAARRRVIIDIGSLPPPNRPASLYHLVYGEEMAVVPTYRELLPVIWEMGILPDIKVLALPSSVDQFPTDREEAIKQALGGSWLAPADMSRGKLAIEGHFEELFEVDGESIIPQWHPEGREMLITWETS